MRTSVTLESMPDGDVGTQEAVKRMSQYVNAARADPLTRLTAVAIVKDCGGRSPDCQIRAIREWLDDHLSFIRDPAGLELFHTPEWQLLQIAKKAYIAVDCDDVAILGAALGKCIGLRARFVIIGFQGLSGPFSHIWAELFGSGGQWRELDITRTRSRSVRPNKFSVVEV